MLRSPRATGVRPHVVVLALALAGVAGCGGVRPRVAPWAGAPESISPMRLHGTVLDLHLARPRHDTPALVVYASGDGGWFGTAIDMWRLVAREGVDTAGFSARAFLKIERPRHARLDPAQLAREYGRVVAHLREALHLPADGPVILAGWSRGAAFSVLAAAERHTVPALAGVVAIGLCDDEDLAIDGPADESDDGDVVSTSSSKVFDPYARLSRVRVPVAVIQSTHDEYFPAAAARARFGPDRPGRRFIAVEARNHRFAGGTAAFDSALHEALQWLLAAHVSSRGMS